MIDKQQKYWMVHRPGGGAPGVAHDTYRSAEEEAYRLARKHPYTVFTILEVVTAVIVNFPEPEEIPLETLPNKYERS